MVKLIFNAWGYSFQEGALTLQRAYQAAEDALSGDLDKATEEAATYRHNVQNGAEPEQELDDGGYLVFDQGDILNMNIEAASGALSAMRKAFVLAFYHHWERSARQWTKLDNAKHDKLSAAVLAMNYPIESGLGGVRDLANTIKHNSAQWGSKLAASWPATLPTGAPKGSDDWYDSVELSAKLMQDVGHIIAHSGPTTQTPW